MTPRISLIICTALAALTVVPAAFGEGQLAGSLERGGGGANTGVSQRNVSGYMDAAERALRIAKVKIAQTHSIVRAGDDHAWDPRATPSPTVTASSGAGADIEWQLGIGFGLGVLLAAGLWLAVRAAKPGPLPH